MRYAILDANNVVVNVELWDEAPAGAIASDTANVGDAWDGASFTPPPSALPSQKEQLLSEIRSLESTVTQRRIREATLGIDNGWLKSLDDQIAAIRAQIRAIQP